ncbi:MAG: formylglycine-generating enzyme family protein [Planctomycetota bacterium]
MREVHDEIQGFLEGEKERKRNHERAMGKVAEGRALVERLKGMREELEELSKEMKTLSREVKPRWPVEKKAPLWDLQERVTEKREAIARTFGEAGARFQEALGFERGNREAREGLADLYWGQFLREEELGDRSQMAYFEGLVREYNDGQYDGPLKGDGALSVTTRRYPCSCLSEGRTVGPEEFTERGFHLCSGRALDGQEGLEGLPDLEPDEPVRLRAHGLDCTTETFEGVDVWLFRLALKRKIFLPRRPDLPGFPDQGGASLPPESVLDRLYDPGSPFRPKEGLYLGKTPIPSFSIPMGSYLLILAGPEDSELRPVRVPVHIGRNATESVGVTLFREGEIPEGFIQVSGGKFICQGDRALSHAGPREILEVEDFFLQKFPIRCRDYLAFLNAGAKEEETAPDGRVPRKAPTTGKYWPKDEGGRYHIPTETRVAGASTEMREASAKMELSPIWWEEEWPILSVSWEDLMTFASWWRREHGYLATLPFDLQWEKSARGVDGRIYPWGVELDYSFCNNNQIHEEGPRPVPVDSFPKDESVFGVRGLGGNARDLCLDGPGELFPGWRFMHGGYWAFSAGGFRSTDRSGFPHHLVNHGMSGRLALFPRCGFRKQERRRYDL